MQLRAATRGSALALWQTRHVVSQLECEIDEVVVSTVGDRNTDVPIHSMAVSYTHLTLPTIMPV